VRYFDKSGRQDNSEALHELHSYRLWIEKNGWTFVPSNLKSG
jgi:hypothetical protein